MFEKHTTFEDPLLPVMLHLAHEFGIVINEISETSDKDRHITMEKHVHPEKHRCSHPMQAKQMPDHTLAAAMTGKSSEY